MLFSDHVMIFRLCREVWGGRSELATGLHLGSPVPLDCSSQVFLGAVWRDVQIKGMHILSEGRHLRRGTKRCNLEVLFSTL